MSWFEFIDYIFKAIILAAGGYLFYFMRNSYEARIEVLKETQVDRYVERMRKFKEFYENMIKDREYEISSLKKEMDAILEQNLSKDEIIISQKRLIEDFNKKIYHYEYKLWEKFLEDSIRTLKIEYGDTWNDNHTKDVNNEIRSWTIKINNNLIKRPSRRYSKKNNEE